MTLDATGRRFSPPVGSPVHAPSVAARVHARAARRGRRNGGVEPRSPWGAHVRGAGDSRPPRHAGLRWQACLRADRDAVRGARFVDLGRVHVRADNIPVYVPPGHALVYVFEATAPGLPVVRRHGWVIRRLVMLVATAWVVAGLTVLPWLTGRLDLQGAAVAAPRVVRPPLGEGRHVRRDPGGARRLRSPAPGPGTGRGLHRHRGLTWPPGIRPPRSPPATP